MSVSFGEAFSQDTFYLWPGKVPGATEAKHDPIQTPDTSRSVIRITDITNPAIIEYKPTVSNGHSIIISPGGGYAYLAVNIEGLEIAQWFNSLGFTAYVLQYRTPDKQKEALYDIQRAVRIVRERATGKVGVIGFSAGGSLSARVSTWDGNDRYPIVDALDSLSCRPDFAMLLYPAYLDKGNERSLTPGLVIDKETPPMFIFATADDAHANSSLVMAVALHNSQVPVEIHLLPTGGHGYGLREGNVAAETWPGLAEVWLKKILSD